MNKNEEKKKLIRITDVSLYTNDDQYFDSGDSFINKISGGGYQPGQLWTIKDHTSVNSLVLTNLAVMAYKHNYNVAYISCRVFLDVVYKIISSNLYDIDSKLYNDKKNIQSILKNNIDKYDILHHPESQFNIFDHVHQDYTVYSIEDELLSAEREYSKKYKKDFKFDVIYFDTLTDLVNDEKLNPYSIALQLKQIAQRNGWCIVSAYEITDFRDDKIDFIPDFVWSALQDNKNHIYLKILLNRITKYADVSQKYNIIPDHMRLEKSN